MIHDLRLDRPFEPSPRTYGQVSLGIERMKAMLGGVDVDAQEAMESRMVIDSVPGPEDVAHFRMNHEGFLWFILTIEGVFARHGTPTTGRLGAGSSEVPPIEQRSHRHLGGHLPGGLTVSTGEGKFHGWLGGGWLSASLEVWLRACREWRTAVTSGTPFSVILSKEDRDWCEPEATGQFRADYVPDLRPPEPASADTDEDEDDEFVDGELHRAAVEGDEELVRSLLETQPQRVNDKNESGETPLHCAIRLGRLELAPLLLDQGADWNLCDAWGVTAFGRAACEGNPQAVRLLLSRGADPAVRSRLLSISHSPLDWAAWRGQPEVIRLLLDHGAQPNHLGLFGNTSLQLAVRMGHSAAAQLLVEKGADVDCPDEDGRTALHWAAFWGRNEIIRLLLDHHANVNARSYRGNTPLLAAVPLCQVETVRLLAAHGADVSSPNGEGQRPRDIAVELGYEELAQVIDDLTRS